MTVSIKDFTKEELVVAIANWMTGERCFDQHPCDLAEDILSGAWLDDLNMEVGDEIQKRFCDQ